MKLPVAVLGTIWALVGSAAPAAAEGIGLAPVHRYVDRATGAAVSLFRPTAERAVIEVRAGRLTVRKAIAPGVTVTRILSDAEDLTISLNREGVAVADGRLGLTISGRDARGLAQARTRLQTSAAVRDAVKLLDGLEQVASSPVSHTLLVSQAMLESALGLAEAGRDLAAWVRRPRASVRALPVAYAFGGGQQDGQELTATDCWTQYVAEAIAAWIEYEQCVDSREWWDVPGYLACVLIYDMRAIGAFSWWVSCVGFRG